MFALCETIVDWVSLILTYRLEGESAAIRKKIITTYSTHFHKVRLTRDSNLPPTLQHCKGEYHLNNTPEPIGKLLVLKTR
jgi:hypothetical protein